ncbi:MAG TPA: hypothetical protein VGP90_13445 [Acidimicrobiia bacterium]|nr:hypothetical protein [Acidimicrobiia bacterium]
MALSVGLLCASAAIVLVNAAGAAPVFAGFDASAGADGTRVIVSAPGAGPVEPPVDLGSVSAQATVNSLGTSSAYGAAPYPGDFGLAGPGTAASLSGLPSPPAYPFIAFSSHPVAPKATVDNGPYHLEATSDAETSQAVADTGQPVPGQNVGRSRASSAVHVAGEKITATSDTLTSGITVGDVLRIGSVHSTASVVQSAGRELERKSSVIVEGVAVVGTGVVLRQDGSPSAGADVLKQAGIVLERLSPVETDHGVVSGALRVTQTQTLPTGTKTTITITLGQARASVATEPALATPGIDTGFSPPPAQAGSPTPAGTGLDALSPASGAVAALPADGAIPDTGAVGPGPAAALPDASTTGAGQTASAPGPATVTLRQPGRSPLSKQAIAARRAAVTTRLTGLYLALLVAGLAGVALAWPARTPKERSPWTS